MIGRLPGPWVGDEVWDPKERTHVIITDVRQRGVPQPVYILRPAHGGPERWTTDDPRRLRTDRPR